MPSNFTTKALLSAISAAAAILTGTTCYAAQAGGTIPVYHLKGTYQGRGLCVQMSPALPTPGGWACVWRTNGLYSEIMDTIRDAHFRGAQCTIAWSTTDANGFPMIDWVSC